MLLWQFSNRKAPAICLAGFWMHFCIDIKLANSFITEVQSYRNQSCKDAASLTSVLNYVPRVRTCLTCLFAFVALLRMCLHFFTCLTCLHFLRALHVLIFLRALRALIFLRVFIFLRVYILFMYILTNLTQINERTYICSSLLLLNSVIYQCLSSIFTSIKLVSYSAYHDTFWNETC